MDKLFNRLSGEMNSLQDGESPLDPRTYKNSYDTLQLAVHHLNMCRNLVRSYLISRPSRLKKIAGLGV
jgi:hypothetical protein